MEATNLGRLWQLCREIDAHFTKDLPFQAVTKIHKYEHSKEWRFDVVFEGTFSRRDLNEIDEIARGVDCYYELTGGQVVFALSIQYKESLNG